MQTRTHAINIELDNLQENLKDADYLLRAGIRQRIKDLKEEYEKLVRALCE